ncbi:DinI-like family protein [Citrobacter freundii]|uniref:DinI-like family protein n=1 Tax=Citrobacter freundii TaxID=546 RepID=A0ABD7AZF5_CITFR|nr:DinI-like family protein [Citrobacter freundii]
MIVELTIDSTKDLPKGAVPALEKELLKRLGNHYENCSLSIRRAGSDGLSVFESPRII